MVELFVAYFLLTLTVVITIATVKTVLQPTGEQSRRLTLKTITVVIMLWCFTVYFCIDVYNKVV